MYGIAVNDELINRVTVQLKDNETPKAGLFRLFAEEFIRTSVGKTAEMVFDNLSPIEWLKARRSMNEMETLGE